MANSDKSITQFPNGTLTEGSLFVAADVNAGTGHASVKHSASAVGEGLCGKIDYQALETGEKTIFGAINELNTIGNYVTLSGTLEAGQTSLTISDNRITTDSMFDVYTTVFGVKPTAVSVSAGSITLTFSAQASDLGVMVNLKAHNGSGGGSGLGGTYIESQDGTVGIFVSEINNINIWFFNGFNVNNSSGVSISDPTIAPYVPPTTQDYKTTMAKAYNDSQNTTYIGDVMFFNGLLRLISVDHLTWQTGTLYATMVVPVLGGVESCTQQTEYELPPQQ